MKSINIKIRLHDLIKTLQQQLVQANQSPQEAEQEAWWMLEALLGTKKINLLQQDTITYTSEQNKTLKEWVAQRIQKKPLAYILGHLPFADLDLLVKPPILIPRPETEEMVLWIINQLKIVYDQKIKILDLCTGTGCIALALAKAYPYAHVVGIDINPAAVKLAEQNKIRNKILNAQFMCADVSQELNIASQFDLIISNPPYVTEHEYAQLDSAIRLWEDYHALVAPKHGSLFYEYIAHQSIVHLDRSSIFSQHHLPRVVVEVGTTPEQVQTIFQNHGFDPVQTYKDMYGAIRWVAAYLTGTAVSVKVNGSS